MTRKRPNIKTLKGEPGEEMIQGDLLTAMRFNLILQIERGTKKDV